VAPTLIRVGGIDDLEREVFGPVLHVATYRAEALDKVIDAINARGYGLTLGLHTRIDDRVSRVAARARVGNLYVNRNQIGAVVGSQPFGGEGLSGTGPKAGGPAYVARFAAPDRAPSAAETRDAPPADVAAVQRMIDAARPAQGALSTAALPGPTGESNRLSTDPRGVVLCLGPSRNAARAQADAAREAGCGAVIVVPGAEGGAALAARLAPDALTRLDRVALVAFDGSDAEARPLRQALAARPGPIVALVHGGEVPALARLERHLCVDTTASGGNATLLAAAAGVPDAAA
jgi:RHH-type proline utilization regulon transcriptional repressor/proline dehydrogenase/delta 1-pyrroline-5-carboxylate dehydrogenase